MTAHHREPKTTSGFRALWPVVDETVPVPELLAEAHADLPRMARFHGTADILDAGPATLRPGRAVPGSGGARLVVTIDATIRLIARAAARHHLTKEHAA